jgi:hypothetical protein
VRSPATGPRRIGTARDGSQNSGTAPLSRKNSPFGCRYASIVTRRSPRTSPSRRKLNIRIVAANTT